MFTSATDGRTAGRLRLLRGAGAWLAAAVFAFVLARVYALFAHGVASPHMRLLFLYPLLGGAALYGLLALVWPGVVGRRGWRAGFNLYNSGLVCAAAGSLLAGIFQIAGTASPYTAWFYVAGGALAAVGVLLVSR